MREKKIEEFFSSFRYRKIPGDACQGGFSPKGRRIDLSKQCSENSKQLVLEEESFGEQKVRGQTKVRGHTLRENVKDQIEQVYRFICSL